MAILVCKLIYAPTLCHASTPLQMKVYRFASCVLQILDGIYSSWLDLAKIAKPGFLHSRKLCSSHFRLWLFLLQMLTSIRWSSASCSVLTAPWLSWYQDGYLWIWGALPGGSLQKGQSVSRVDIAKCQRRKVVTIL